MITSNKVTQTAGSSCTKVRIMAQVSMLGALAAVLMLFEFPLPFIAPPFYELDFSEVPVLIGAFSMGPMAGAAIELFKILLNFVLNGTQTAGVGELGNLIMGCALIMPAAFIYKQRKTKKNAMIGLLVGTICTSIAGCVVNAVLLIPAYGKAFGIPTEGFVGMGAAIFPAIDSIFKLCLLCVTPFNLIKGCVVSLITLLLYKHISPLLKSNI